MIRYLSLIFNYIIYYLPSKITPPKLNLVTTSSTTQSSMKLFTVTSYGTVVYETLSVFILLPLSSGTQFIVLFFYHCTLRHSLRLYPFSTFPCDTVRGVNPLTGYPGTPSQFNRFPGYSGTGGSGWGRHSLTGYPTTPGAPLGPSSGPVRTRLRPLGGVSE